MGLGRATRLFRAPLEARPTLLALRYALGLPLAALTLGLLHSRHGHRVMQPVGALAWLAVGRIL